MQKYWTVIQAQSQAKAIAEEMGNRQILISGLGTPNQQAPIGVEYDDHSLTPAVRYRKTGSSPLDWTRIDIIEKASTEDINQGIDNYKMITPLKLEERLAIFSKQILGIPSANVDKGIGIQNLIASSSTPNTLFSIFIPEKLDQNNLSISISGYGSLAVLESIQGGFISQIITIRRAETHSLQLTPNLTIRLSDDFTLKDAEKLDHITLQKLSPTTWVELSRNQFTQ